MEFIYFSTNGMKGPTGYVHLPSEVLLWFPISMYIIYSNKYKHGLLYHHIGYIGRINVFSPQNIDHRCFFMIV